MRYSCSSLAPVPADLAVPQRQSLTVGQGADFVIVFGLFALSVSPNGQRGIVGHAYSCCGRQDVRGTASWSWQAQRVENPVEAPAPLGRTRGTASGKDWHRGAIVFIKDIPGSSLSRDFAGAREYVFLVRWTKMATDLTPTTRRTIAVGCLDLRGIAALLPEELFPAFCASFLTTFLRSLDFAGTAAAVKAFRAEPCQDGHGVP